jgi:hypothetical protein
LKITLAEQHLLELLIYDPELQEKILPLLEETDYESLATAAVFRALYELQARKLDATLENMIEFVADDELVHDFVPLLMITEPQREPGEVIDTVLHKAENCVFTLRSMAISNRIREVAQETLYAQQIGDREAVERLTYEHLDLEKIHRQLLSKIAET